MVAIKGGNDISWSFESPKIQINVTLLGDLSRYDDLARYSDRSSPNYHIGTAV